MDTIQDDTMVALIPQTNEWCKIDPAHTTIIYPGKKSQLDPIVKEELIKLASSVAIISNPIVVKISGQEVMGQEDKVEVFRLELTPELSSLRNIFESWDDSEFPVYKPHATIGPEGTVVENPPLFLLFDRIMVGWGEERMIFWLRRF